MISTSIYLLAASLITLDPICHLKGIDLGNATEQYFDIHKSYGQSAGLGCFEFKDQVTERLNYVQVEITQKNKNDKVKLSFWVYNKESGTERKYNIELENSIFFDDFFIKEALPADYVIVNSAYCSVNKNQAACFLHNVAHYIAANDDIDDNDKVKVSNTLTAYEMTSSGKEMTILVSSQKWKGEYKLFSPISFSDRKFSTKSEQFGTFRYFVSESINWGAPMKTKVLSMMRDRRDNKQTFFLGSEGGGFYTDNNYCFALTKKDGNSNSPKLFKSPSGAMERHNAGYINVVRQEGSGTWSPVKRDVIKPITNLLQMAVSSESVWWNDGWTIDPELLIETTEKVKNDKCGDTP